MHKINIGIDASRCRSGGAKAHIIGILSHNSPSSLGINEIHIWSYRQLLDMIPNKPWIIKHASKYIESNLISQLYWQFFLLKKDLDRYNCDILFSADASTVCRYKKMVTLSQDLLSYEPEIMKLFGISAQRLRLFLIKHIQNHAFKSSNGVIFLTKYASTLIQRNCGNIKNYTCIPHGFDSFFQKDNPNRSLHYNANKPIHCLYVSNASMYKNQWNVVKAIEILKNRYNIHLSIVGGGKGRAKKLLDKQLKISDPNNLYIKLYDFLPQNDIKNFLLKSDIFIFASSCEAFGITLLEAMSTKIPIACSNRSSLPETLQNGGVYFDPTDPKSISKSLELIITNYELRNKISSISLDISKKYTWDLCSTKTFQFLHTTARDY